MPTMSASGPVAKPVPAADAAADRPGAPDGASAEFQGLLLALAGLALPAMPADTPVAGEAVAENPAPVAAAAVTLPGLPVALPDGSAAPEAPVPAAKLAEPVTPVTAAGTAPVAGPAAEIAAESAAEPAAAATAVANPAGKATEPVAETTAKVADPAVPAAPATQHATGAASPEPATSSTGSPAATPEVTAPQGQPAPQDSGQDGGQSTGQDSGRGGHGDGKPAVDLTPTVAAPADAARPAATPPAEAAAMVSSVDGQRPAAPEVATVPVQGVQAPAPAAPAAQVAPAAAPERAAPALPAQQLAAEIVPLRDKQGEHALTISLHPADLGPVTVTARVQGTDIQLDLGGATESGREAIRAALPELRRELERAGFTSCLLDTNAGGSTGERRMPWYLPRTGGEPGDDAGPRSAHPEPNATTRATRPAAGVLDLHA